jgi:hypothetical protein
MMLLALASRRLPTLSPKLLCRAEARPAQQSLARIPLESPVQVRGIPVTKHRRATLYLKSHRLTSQSCHPALRPIHFVVMAAHSFWTPHVRQKHPRYRSWSHRRAQSINLRRRPIEDAPAKSPATCRRQRARP